MPKLPFKKGAAQATGLLKFWKEVRTLSVAQIAEEAERPFVLALTGGEDQTRLLAARLALETPTPKDTPHGPANVWPYLSVHASASEAPKDSLRLDAEALAADEALLAPALAQLIVANPDLRLSLARHIPAFRPAVAAQLIADTSWANAKIATLSALPGMLPFMGMVLPATSVGDMVLLTRNQGLMLLRIAAAYGLPVDLRERTRELLPVVGSAFGWRALARELIGLLPGGFGVVLKGSVAYAGTYTVGKAAQIYYSTGQTLSTARLQQLGRDAAKESRARLQQWLRREKPLRVRRGKTGTPADLRSRDIAAPVLLPERGTIVSPLQDPERPFVSETIDKPVQIGV